MSCPATMLIPLLVDMDHCPDCDENPALCSPCTEWVPPWKLTDNDPED